jgi:hypothetical protein
MIDETFQDATEEGGNYGVIVWVDRDGNDLCGGGDPVFVYPVVNAPAADVPLTIDPDPRAGQPAACAAFP